VLEYVNALPGSERGFTADDRNGKTRLGERRADVGSHVVWTFARVPVALFPLRDKVLEKIPQIKRYIRIGILLNDERARRVLYEEGE